MPDSPATDSGKVGSPSRLVADGWRARVAAVPAVALTALALTVAAIAGPPGGWEATVVVAVLVGYNVFAAVYVSLSWRVFAGVADEQFAALIGARQAQRRRGMQRLMPSGDGPSFAITSSVLALAVVVVVPHVPALSLDDWVLVPISLTILLSCWGVSVVSYALHYAQHDLADPGLEFPGERTNAFEDYVYFAVAVATTLGATDITIVTVKMRRIVNVNVVVSFLYNSVVVALLASILIRS